MSRLPRGLPVLARGGRIEARRFPGETAEGKPVVMRRDDPFAQVVVPAHRSIDTGTLGSILEAAGVSIDEFLELL